MKKIIYHLIFYLPLLVPAQVFAAISFSISNPQTTDDKITIDVSISGLSSSSCPDNNCYLQAAFTSQTQTRYFGYTQNNNNEWYKYDGSPEQDYIKSTFFNFHPQDGNWSGTLTIKVDEQDSDYDGPGTYDLKVWRYSGNSNSSSGDADNLLPIELTVSQPTPQPTSTPNPTSSPTPKPTSSSTTASTKKSPSPTPQKNPTPSASPSSSPEVLGQKDLAQGFTELGAADIVNSPSPSPSTYDNPFNKNVSKILIGAGILFIIISSGVYLWYKRSLGQQSTINKGNERFEEKEE